MTPESGLPAQLNAEIDDALHMARLGGADSAYAKLEQVLNHARSAGFRGEEARALLGLSHVVKWVATAENSFATSERLAREALAIYTEIEDQPGIAKCSVVLAPWSGEDGERMLDRALETFRAAGDRKEVARVLERQATHLALRDPAEAGALRTEALSLFEEIGDLGGQADVLFGMSIAEMENRERWREYGLRALDLYRVANRPKQVAQMRMMLDDKDLPATERIPGLEEGIRMAADTNTFIWQASMMRNLADCFEELGRTEEAVRVRREANEICPEEPEDDEAMEAFAEALESGDPDRMAEAIKAWGDEEESE